MLWLCGLIRWQQNERTRYRQGCHDYGLKGRLSVLNQLQPMLMQAHGRKRGRKVKPRPIYVSRKIEVKYTKALLTIVDDMHSETVRQLMPFATLQMGDGKMAVADGHLDGLLFVFDELKAFITGRVATVANGIATKIVDAQKQASDEQLAGLLKKQTGIDLMGLMGDEDLKQAVDEAIYANVSLIKSIPKEDFDRVEKAVMVSLQAGTLYQDLADELGRIHAIGQNRARLIASDQLGKINSRLSQVRQQALGISHYTWSTSQDERVRHEHVLRDGRRFAWDNPPAGGHPGQAIRCRCVAVPDTSHLFGGVAEQEKQDMLESYQDLISAEIQRVIFFSTSSDVGEIFNPKKLQRILKVFEKQNVPYLIGEEGERFARQMNAQAIYYPAGVGESGFFAFPKNPTRTQVVEEILHYGQHRKTGFASLEWKDIVKLEIEAQHKLLAISKHLQWSDAEIEQIKRALARWEIELSALP